MASMSDGSQKSWNMFLSDVDLISGVGMPGFVFNRGDVTLVPHLKASKKNKQMYCRKCSRSPQPSTFAKLQ